MERKEAIEKKLLTYFTGKPCKYGHIAERQTISGSCVICAQDHNKSRSNLRKLLKGG